MKAVVVKDGWLKSADELTVTEWEEPSVQPNTVKIAVKSAGLNFFDILLVTGKYQLKPPFPFIPGSEFSGIVTEVGDGVTRFRVGDRVFGGNHLGSFAEYIVVADEQVFPLPATMSFDEGASVYITLPTSYAGIVLRADLKPTEWCLVHAGAGGVGIAAVQFAKAIGAKVIATAGSDEKMEVAKLSGADHVVNYRDKNWQEQVKQITDGRGVDVVYDPVGLIDESTKCMAWNGRLVVVGFAGGKIPKIASNRILLKNISIVGLHWGAYKFNEVEAIPRVWNAVLKLHAEGKVKPVIYPSRFSLETLPQGLEAIASRKTYGKVILRVDGNQQSKL